jgi:hypothetical protein
MWQAWNDTTNNTTVTVNKAEIVESFKKHFFNTELKEEAVGDQVAEIIFRKFVEQTNLAAATGRQLEHKKGHTEPIDDTVAAETETAGPADAKMKRYLS